MANTPAPLSTKRNTLWNAAGCIFYLGCQWLTTVLVVTFSTDYNNSGALAFAMSVGNMFASVSLYKMRTFQVSDITCDHSAKDYVGFRFVSILFSLIMSCVYVSVISDNASFLIATLAFLGFKIDETFVDVLYGVDQKGQRMDYIGKSQFMRGALSLIGFVVPLVMINSLPAAIIGMTLCCMLVTFFYDLPHAKRFGDIKPRFARAHLFHLGKACLMPTIANFLATSIVSIVRQRYGVLAGQELLGIYASIATPAVLIQAGATYLYSPLIGTLAGSLQDGGAPAFKKSFFKVLGLLVACMALVTIGFSFIGGPLLELVYGNKIEPYLWIFPYVLGATTSIAILLYVNDSLLIMRDGITQIIINALAFAVIVLAADQLVAAFDMNGINVAIIAACVPATVAGAIRIATSK
ncbi:lipopolysaccharide biosynthesis protein [Collinsella bouchesdurhonensis]|uniref:lipopolysaccharide biosynthesis protein n=1 Tax=Collinsella bouchesdurhonensis TaxID=1907654 RepID=UPI003F90475B